MATWAFSSKHRKETIRLKNRSLGETFSSFFTEGFSHLLTGWDHLWFLLLIFLVCTSLRQLVLWITAFTIAHALALLCSFLGFVRVPGVAVESGIALSICAMAYGVWRRDTGPEPASSDPPLKELALILIFGLIHGLGFASFLKSLLRETADLYFGIFAFHVGLEVAQIAVTLAFILLLWPFRSKALWPYFTRAIAIAGFGFGLFWTIQRLFLSSP